MKHQALLSSKDKKIKVPSAAILLGALRVKIANFKECVFNYQQQMCHAIKIHFNCYH